MVKVKTKQAASMIFKMITEILVLELDEFYKIKILTQDR